MHHTTFDALGTKWWIEIFDDITEQQSAVAFGHCSLLLQEFEAKYSRFKTDSLISKLNHERVLHNPDEELVEILRVGKSLFKRTNGFFNILVGQELEARGYDATYSLKASDKVVDIGNPETDLHITEENIRLDKGNIDIGGFGKGYAIDKVATKLKELGIQYFFINAGGDIFATSENGKPIEIHLEHPTELNKSIGTTTLLNEGLAASSTFRRQWTSDGKVLTHIVGENIEQLASFVKAKTAGDADAFSTTALLTDRETLLELATRENISIARFSPTTSKLWTTPSFSIQANVN